MARPRNGQTRMMPTNSRVLKWIHRERRAGCKDCTSVAAFEETITEQARIGLVRARGIRRRQEEPLGLCRRATSPSDLC